MGGLWSSERGRCITGVRESKGPLSGRGGGERVCGSRTSYSVLRGFGLAREPTLQGSPVGGAGEEEASETCRLFVAREAGRVVAGKSVVERARRRQASLPAGLVGVEWRGVRVRSAPRAPES